MNKPKITIFSMTRDRIDYSKRSFSAMRKTAGVDFDHIVLDNGSEDGTLEWLKKNKHLFKKVILCPENVGLWAGFEIIRKEANNFMDYDFVCKVDNDVEFPDKDWLKKIYDTAMSAINEKWVLSPYVDGLGSGLGGAPRHNYTRINQERIGLSNHVGGICLFSDAKLFADFKSPPINILGKVGGWDVFFCGQAKQKGYKVGYIEGIKVKHMDTTMKQQEDKPDYYNRKVYEAKIPYDGDMNNYKIL